MEDYDIVKADFNDIAELGPEPKWNHNNCYFGQLLKQIPEKVGTCLDIGCGKGELSLLLSRKADKVTAVDLADKMIAFARAHNNTGNIEYICGNILDMHFADTSLDIIISTATAHHLPYDWLLDFAKSTLKKGGKLIILDLAKASTPVDYLIWGAAFLPNLFMSLIKNGRLRKDDPHAAEVWRKHGAHDTYMTMKEIRKLTQKHLSGAVIRRRLFWRYTLVWEKSTQEDKVMDIQIRHETERDYRAVEELTREAFWNIHVPGCNEHFLLHILRDSADFIPELDFVALYDGKIVGNIVYSRSTVTDERGTRREVITFGPVSVLPEYQKKGVGSALIQHSLSKAEELCFPAVLIYGDPRYYSRFGFRCAERYDICSADGKFSVALMALPLRPAGLDGVTGRFEESPAFNVDEASADAFDTAFPTKEKGFAESQRTFQIISSLRY